MLESSNALLNSLITVYALDICNSYMSYLYHTINTIMVFGWFSGALMSSLQSVSNKGHFKISTYKLNIDY